MADGKPLQPWQIALREKSELLHRTFNNPTGEECLKMLSNTFQRGTLFDECALKMARQVGQYEVVEYIKEMLEAVNSHE